ncbi:MAG: VTT domain-containing protein [Chloroflexi bacterium]|nr:VTT domain-containing protein [Chloroflexota bacterium]
MAQFTLEAQEIEKSDASTPPVSSRWLQFLLAALPLVLVTAVVAILRPDLRALAAYGYAGVFGIMLVGNATVLLPLPGLATVAAAGALWNPLLVGLAGGLGGAAGEVTGYLAGRGAHQLVDVSRAQWLSRFEGWVRRYGFWAILVFATVPNPFFDVVGIAAGSFAYPPWRFFAAVWLGNTIKCTAVALAAGTVTGFFFGG